MSFFSKMLNTFGFGSDNEEYEDDSPAVRQPAPETAPASVSTQIPEPEQKMVRSIFDKVLDIVNASLPDFLAKSVDPEKQKQYMFDALEESVKAYILQLDEDARRRCEVLWQQERSRLQAEMESLKSQTKQLENKRNEIKERQLSADRQKRALSDKVHDLEAQILKLEAEKEQYELENRSLLNKAKIAAVYEKELEELRSASAPSPIPSAAPDPELIAKIETLTAELEAVKAEKQQLADACEAAKTKDEMGDSMVEDLRKIAAREKARAGELEAALEALKQEFDLASARLDDANAKIEELGAKEAENEVTHTQLLEISAQVERFTDVKEKLDARILQLKENLQKAQAENESLRDTIKNNLFQHAAQEKELRDENERLKARLASVPNPADQQSQAGARSETDARRRRPRASDADTSDVADVITNTDFLTSEPDPSRFPAKEETEFGYTAPPRKPKPDNKAQMSLFGDE